MAPSARFNIGEREVNISEISAALRNTNYSIIENKYSAAFLRGFGFSCKVVIDVGVRGGTPELYKAFPDAKFLLFEPDPACEEIIARRWNGRLDYRLFKMALGAEAATLTLRVQGGGSTLLAPRRPDAAPDRRFEGEIEVPVRRLDEVLDELGHQGPFGLKIDTEGFEHAVLTGAGRRLLDAEFVLAELDVIPRFQGVPLFSDNVLLLREYGLEFVSILNDKTGRQRFYDCLFIRRTHPLLAG